MTGFVVVDLEDAAVADGQVRLARKILLDGARTMARSRTYAWALLEQQVSGASAGVSVAPEHRDAGVAEFVAAVTSQVVGGSLALDAGKGVEPADLASLDAADGRSPMRHEVGPTGSLSDELLAIGAVAAAATTAAGGLEGRRVAVEGAGSALPALLDQLGRAGAKVVAVGTGSGTVQHADGFDVAELAQHHREHGEGLAAALDGGPAGQVLGVDAETLFCGSKLGLIDHDVAASLSHRVVVPVGAVPVTAKGLAVAMRRDIVVLADFLTTSGPLHAFRPAEGASPDDLRRAAEQHVSSLTEELASHAEGPLIGACMRAEEYLRTWREALPFGRPLA